MEGLVYLVLGCKTSGRRQSVYDLISDVAKEEDPFTVLVSTGETPNDWTDKIRDTASVTIELYEDGVDDIASDQLNPHHINLILTPGNADPVDQVEALKPLLEPSGCHIGRIITIVDCDLLKAHNKLETWYDACIHFSDACIIHRSPEMPNQFVQDFIDRYKDKQYPCLFETVSKGRIKNPGLILEPQARRISLYFEPEEDLWLDSDDEEWEEPQEDPYMVRLPSGKREKWLHDVQSILRD